MEVVLFGIAPPADFAARVALLHLTLGNCLLAY
jgi:hypothetical protein